jgi:hypothetical protein
VTRFKKRQGKAQAAIFAALLLFVQLLVGGYAVGVAAAGAPMLDAFGHPLCITSTNAAEDSGAGHSGLPDCCAPGCSMFAPMADVERETAALPNPLPVLFLQDAPAAPASGRLLAKHDPAQPRAPPLPFG